MNNLYTKAGYTIYFDEVIASFDAFVEKGNYSKVVILGDGNTLQHCLPILNLQSNVSPHCDIIEIDPGEENKNIDICIGIWSMMQDFNMNRKSLLVNLGGGMIGDMGGFAASTYMRGIDFVQFPTSLLAMVDASIGGKTGIDFQHYKNHLGTFSNPSAVFILSEFLATLHVSEMRSGYAEMVKHGIIADHMHLKDLNCFLELGLPGIPELIQQSVEIKKNIVELDPFEKNERRALNFGHTIAHAIESYYLSIGKEVMHGSAVAYGLIVESYMSMKYGILSESEYAYILDSVMKHLEPAKVTADMIIDMVSFMKKDKKNTSDKVLFSLINSIAEPNLGVECTEEQITNSLLHCIHYFNDEY